ncbi:MAG: cytochrome P450 [Actinobacteria bacterium]|nr:cytochrome P450 [Actinomycetota bacterium]
MSASTTSTPPATSTLDASTATPSRSAGWPASDAGGLFHRSHRWADMDRWHQEVAEIRRDHPVLLVQDEEFGPFWALTRHEDIFAVSRDSAHWKNTTLSVLASDFESREMVATPFAPRSLVQLDGHEHTAHRRVTNDWFKPAAVGARQDRIDEIADLFIARMRELDGECDFAVDIAQPYTLRVIMDIYGIPESDEPLMLELTQGIFGANDPEFMGADSDPLIRAGRALMTFVQYFNEITTDRRACPADDLATVIANGQVDGCPIGDAERLWYFILVATAGHDTTSFALSGGLQVFLDHPEQWASLRGADDTAIARAADEIVRWTTPVRHFMRFATEPTSIRGVEIPEGGRVLLSYPSANRDEAVFADPMRFDVNRPDIDRLLSFGVGAHFCLGSQFARRELRTFLKRLLNEVDTIEAAGDPAWSESHFVSGVKHLPIRYSFR